MKFKNIKSCFLGLAIGDALGVPVEFNTRSALHQSPVKDLRGFGTWNQPPGTWSDDSSLTFCLAESLVSGYDVTDIGRKFLAWYKEGYWGARYKLFDIGQTTRFAIARIAGGENPLFSGDLSEDANGNGSLMRIAPAPLYFHDHNDSGLYQKIKEISAITHAHFRSVFSCYFFSKYMIELLKGMDKFQALTAVTTAVINFAEASEFNPSEIERFRRIMGGNLHGLAAEEIYSSGYVLHTLEAALWSFLTTDSFENAVLKAVNLGEDTDTTGCVTGALAGLYYGEDTIPLQWRTKLARENDIIKLAEDFTESIQKRILH